MVIVDVIDVVVKKALQTHLHIYHLLHIKCLQYDSATSSILYEQKLL